MTRDHQVFGVRASHSSCAAVVLLWMLSFTVGQAATAVLEMEQSQISVGDTATLTLRVEGASVRGRQHPNIPVPPGLQISPAGQSTQVSIINGRQSMQLALIYSLQAGKAGDYTLASVEVPTDAGVLRTKPVSLKVLPPSALSLGNAPAFLRLAPAKTNIYVGEALMLDLQLFAEEGKMVEEPKVSGEGFNFSKIAQPVQTRRNVNGRIVNLVTFRLAAFAVKPGPLKLGPASLLLEVPRPGSRPDFFGFRPTQAFRPTAEEVGIQVLSPPPGAPPEFNGAVGRFELTYSAGPRQLTVGDPITLKASIRGVGMLDGVRMPDLSHWAGFKLYPPNSRTEAEDTLEISGVRHFEQVISPQNPELKEVPEFRWAFFDPELQQYNILRGAAVPLQLAASAPPTSPLPSLVSTNTAATPVGLLEIRHSLGVIPTSTGPAWHQPNVWLLQGIPFLLWAWLRWIRLRAEFFEKNPRVRRQKETATLVAQCMSRLPELAKSNNGAEFFQTLTKALRAQIGERLDMPDSGITEDIIHTKLRPAGLPQADITTLGELFDQANQFSFASQLPSGGLAPLVSKAQSVIEALQKLPPPK